MSGFAGFASPDQPVDEERLLGCFAEHLKFRGPDSNNVAIHAGAGFCFTFLQTGPAPQSVVQPCSLDGKVWLLGDVRLDGRDELRRRLGSRGASFPEGLTDEELILQAWRTWGPGCLPLLLGDFSVALWDSEAQRLVCARDLIGLRPFYYAQAGGRLYFSNTLSTLRLPPEISYELDGDFIGDFLLEGWCFDPERTAFREIRRLPPGHLLEFSREGLQVKRFTELAVEEPFPSARKGQYVEEFRALFESAVRDRLPAGRSAIFMSGGLDSTSVAAQAVRLASQCDASLHAYTVDCSSLMNDQESVFASRAAAHLHIPITIDGDTGTPPFHNWSDAVAQAAEPYHEPFFTGEAKLYRKISQQARVALSGDGGDDVLTGQAWPHLRYLLRRRQFGAAAKIFGGYFLTNKRIPPLGAGIRTRWNELRDPQAEFAGYPPWLNPDFEKAIHLRERWQALRGRTKPLGTHPLHPLAYSALKKPYWAHIYEAEDASWSGTPMERRAPLLDLRIIKFLLRLPPVPWCMEKELLRLAMRGLLPEEVRLRKKTPLSTDPFVAYVEKFRWKPLLPEPSPVIFEFVDWRRFKMVVPEASSSELCAALTPVSLLYWLVAQEKPACRPA
ncbi:MAG: lasso peptide isopeptide bond-forming cyclase [Candidatus Acidiferrum sp.]